MKKKPLYACIIVLLIIIAVLFLKPLVLDKKKDTGVKWNTEEKEVRYIKIPSFSEVYFRADTDVQGFNFSNSPTNRCAMILTLAKDGRVYYRSGKINPGYGLHEIKLNEPLSRGDYQFTYIVECYSPEEDNNERLNGANFGVTVHVR